ncbi:MAG: hydroxymethylbilane synthase [Pseudobutyrivibrio sp.]|nr:hydroxymethylbilane synthase [Pseudobutyrivibrio sp.]
MIINVGTRGSKLALAQTNNVISRLKEKFPDNEYNVVVITTTGDKDTTRPLDAIGSKGLFVDEIEKSLLNNEIQMAVHSMKDMPSSPMEGLVFANPWEREDPRDALLLKEYASLKDLPENAVIATGSKRRSYQLLRMRPDLQIVSIRGNIDTRIRKLHEGLADGTQLDGIVLAAAGLKRLHLEDNITEYFDVNDMIPSPAQGTLAIEVAKDNQAVLDMVNSLSDVSSKNITFLERGFLSAIGGDCHLPIGAYASFEEGKYHLKALFGTEDGKAIATAESISADCNQSMIDAVVNDILNQLKEF